MITLERIAPLGGMLVSGHCGVAGEPVYPPTCIEAQALRQLRRKRHVYLGDAARALGITVVQLCDLERGRARPVAPSSWSEVLGIVRALPPSGRVP